MISREAAGKAAVRPSNSGGHVSFRNGFDLRLSECRQIYDLGAYYPSREVNVVLAQIFLQGAQRATFAGSVPNQDDLIRGYQGSGHFFVEGCFFGYALAFIVSLLAMHQMAMEVVRIVGGDAHCVLRKALAGIAKNMRCVMIDYYDHSTGLKQLRCARFSSGFFKKFPKPGHLFDADLRRVRLLEHFAPCTHHEGKFISMCLNLA